MPYTVEYLEDVDIISIESVGDMDYQDYKQQTEEAVLLSRKYETGLYLSDVCKIVNRARLSDVIKINKLYEELGQSKDTRLAIIADRGQKEYTLIKIFELSCTVRGWKVRCFQDGDEAIRWLRA